MGSYDGTNEKDSQDNAGDGNPLQEATPDEPEETADSYTRTRGLMPFSEWSFMACSTPVIAEESDRRGVEPYAFIAAAETALNDPSFRCADEWAELVRALPVDDDVVLDEGEGVVALGLMPPPDADTVSPIGLGDFYRSPRIGALNSYLDSLTDGEGRALWDAHRDMLVDLLYSGDLLTEWQWFELHMRRDWDVPVRDYPENRDAVRGRRREVLRRAQVAVGLVPTHGARLREKQDWTVEVRGDAVTA
uniref:hypothetical protein n=1 Tax=Gordonia sp. B7-2 TaxID=3420932 RepID=UPI003D93FF17